MSHISILAQPTDRLKNVYGNFMKIDKRLLDRIITLIIIACNEFRNKSFRPREVTYEKLKAKY